MELILPDVSKNRVYIIKDYRQSPPEILNYQLDFFLKAKEMENKARSETAGIRSTKASALFTC